METKSDPTDGELVRSMLAGEEEAFALLYRRRHGGVYRFALQMCGSPEVAEDVTQDVFIFLMREGHIFDPSRGSLNAFLLGVTRNHVLRRLRGDQMLIPLAADSEEDTPHDHLANQPGPLEDMTRAETIENVRKAVLTLPERYREVIVLCELQELSYVETAEVLGCAIGTVRSRLHRARALLLEKLRPSALEEGSCPSAQSARCFA
jgi:RNA polymerase sigma-70 factor (ECF subfamily)